MYIYVLCISNTSINFFHTVAQRICQCVGLVELITSIRIKPFSPFLM